MHAVKQNLEWRSKGWETAKPPALRTGTEGEAIAANLLEFCHFYNHLYKAVLVGQGLPCRCLTHRRQRKPCPTLLDQFPWGGVAGLGLVSYNQ